MLGDSFMGATEAPGASLSGRQSPAGPTATTPGTFLDISLFSTQPRQNAPFRVHLKDTRGGPAIDHLKDTMAEIKI